jgi:predicted RNA-binding protein (TIGR00451 family)
LNSDLAKIRSVADYQFGKNVGAALFPDNVEISYSRNTGRIRYVHLSGLRLATMRPTDGLFSLGIAGAERIAKNGRDAKCFVQVRDDIEKFVAEGGDVFAVHIVEADDEIRSSEEVIIVDDSREVLAVGRALLSGEEMKAFKRGVAVKVRRGRAKEG